MINLLNLEMLEYVEAKLFNNGKPINSINSIIALQNEDFKRAGEVMVMSILQGGLPQHFYIQLYLIS
jgi:hypothetical protein